LLNTILGSFSTGAPPVAPSSYESIATVTVGSGGAADIQFTSIPADYTHLQIRSIARTSGSAGGYVYMQYNSDTGSNYTRHQLWGDGSTVYAYGASASTAAVPLYETISTSLASSFAATVIDILDYANTNKYKTYRSLNGYDVNGSGGNIFLHSSVWLSTSAITSIKFYPEASQSFAQYTQFALYGIKGS
jgi:hypothetical protein